MTAARLPWVPECPEHSLTCSRLGLSSKYRSTAGQHGLNSSPTPDDKQRWTTTWWTQRRQITRPRRQRCDETRQQYKKGSPNERRLSITAAFFKYKGLRSNLSSNSSWRFDSESSLAGGIFFLLGHDLISCNTLEFSSALRPRPDV